jgi:hypothetical protein
MSGAARSALGTIGRGLRELLGVRWVRVVAIVALLLAVGRFGGVWVLGRTVKSIARDHGLVCSWDELSLSVFDGRGEVRFLSFVPTDGADAEIPPQPLFEIEYAIFDLDVRALLSGELSVRRAEVDGLDSRLERSHDGRWNIEEHVDIAQALSILEAQGDEPQADDTPEEDSELRLAPPLAITALRIQHARMHLIDRAVSPELDTVLEASVRLSNLGAVDRRVRFSVTVTGSELLDGATLDGVATWEESSLAVELTAQAGSFRPGPLSPYLGLLWIEPRAESIEAECDATLLIEVLGEERDRLGGRLAITDLGLATDGEVAFRVEHVEVDLAAASADGVEVPAIVVSGVRGGATLDDTGAIEVGGFALLPGPPTTSTQPKASFSASFAEALAAWASVWAPEQYPRWAALFARSDPDAFPWSLGRFAVNDVALALIDQGVVPQAELEFVVDAFEVGPIVHDPALARAPVPLSATMRAPGIAESIRVDGTLSPFAPDRGADITLLVEGIGLDALAPYLKQAGLEDALDAGTLRAHLIAEAQTDESGRTEGWVELEELALTGEEELFGVRSMAAKGLVIDPAQGLVRLGEIVITGPSLLLARDPSRGFFALGLRTIGGDDDASIVAKRPLSQPEPVDAPTPSRSPVRSDLPIPRLEIGRLAWIGTDVEFVDDSVDPPGKVVVDEMGFELLGLTVGGDPDGPEHEPARFSARFVVGDLAEELRVEGAIRSQPGPIDLTAELTASGHGLQGRLAAPYLRELGLEPTLVSGSLTGSLDATVREAEGGWHASLHARDVKLADEGTPLIGVGELAVEDVALDPNGIAIGRVSVAEPFASIELEPDGALRAAGLRLLAADPDAKPSSSAGDGVPTPLALPSLPAVRLDQLELTGARLQWSDASRSEPVALDLTAGLELGRIDLSGGESGTYRAALSLPGVIEAFTVEGTLQLAPELWTITAGVTGEGLSGSAIGPYLPAPIRPGDRPGTLQGRFTTTVAPHADGGLRMSLASTELGLRSGDEPGLTVSSASATIERFDPAAGLVLLDSLETEGVELSLRRDVAGAVHALGFVLDPAAEPAPVLEDPDTNEGSTEGRATRTAPPRVEIVRGIDVGIDRLTLRDESLHDESGGRDARPIVVSLRSRVGPAVLLAPDPRELPPIEAELGMSVEGLIDSTVVVTAAPFADPATVRVRFDAQDVRTHGLIETLPALAPLVEGEVEAGSMTAALDVQLDVRRSAPFDTGLARAFGVELQLTDVDYFGQPDQRSLAGVDAIVVEGRIDPAKGIVQLKTIDIRNPHGFVRRDADGVHAFGLLIVPPPAEDVAAEPLESSETITNGTPGIDGVLAVEASTPREPETAPPSSAEGELRIDELLVSGLDFEIVDETGEPPLRIPLVGLDAELKRFTTRMFSEPRPVSFSAYLAAGASDHEGGRPVFDEVAVAGRIAVTPEPKGWAQVTLAGLELLPFAGLAANSNVSVDDGALDANVRLRLKGEKGGKVSSSMVFTDLDLAETEGGPIQRLLSLPASLDAILFLLRNQDGEHRFSVGFPVTEDGVSTSSLAVAAAGAATEVIARAVAGAPLRLIGGLIPGSGEPEKKPQAEWSVDFAPGEVDVPSEAFAALERAASRMNSRGALIASIRHETAPGELDYAARLANPSR